ncbi:MAG: hypothetical protein MJA27_02010 [Pseudanabaenales cyanobacterium]|nr:hypothetical protein [Pseudanabaenales cyanobacterium]
MNCPYEQGATVSCIGAYVERWRRWVRRGVGGLGVAGVGLGEIMRMACSPLPVSVLVSYGGAYRTLQDLRSHYPLRNLWWRW